MSLKIKIIHNTKELITTASDITSESWNVIHHPYMDARTHNLLYSVKAVNEDVAETWTKKRPLEN